MMKPILKKGKGWELLPSTVIYLYKWFTMNMFISLYSSGIFQVLNTTIFN